MDIQPILSALLRNRTSAILVILQVALTMAVVVNAMFIINQRLAKMNRDSGIDVENIIVLQSWGFARDYDHKAVVTRDVQYLASLPGVTGVTPTSGLPVSNGGSANDFRAYPGEVDESGAAVPTINANYYYMNEQGIDALGVELASGRRFFPEEIVFREPNSAAFVPSVIITRDLAEEFFGTPDALGKTVYDFLGNPAEVVGLIEHMHGAWVDWDKLTNVMIMPGVPAGPFLRYMIRVEPGMQDELLREIEAEFPKIDRSRMIRSVQPYAEIVGRAYARDHSMTVLLIATIILLVSISGLGIIGLASFAVRQRTKQIGTRRAIGASQRQIMQYFMMENWLVTTIGVIVGTILAIAFNIWLVDTYALDRLDWKYIPVGVVALWMLGQLAVLMPALRAAAIAPAIATRTV